MILWLFIGIFAVTGVSPLAAREPVSAAAMSDSVLFCTVLLMVVPVSTGFPAGRLYVPLPLRAIYTSPMTKDQIARTIAVGLMFGVISALRAYCWDGRGAHIWRKLTQGLAKLLRRYRAIAGEKRSR